MSDCDYPFDLNKFCWKEISTDDADEPRLLTPRSDPMVHEFPVDGIWPTAEDAIAWRLELFTDEPDVYEDAKDWVLVHYVGTIVPTEPLT